MKWISIILMIGLALSSCKSSEDIARETAAKAAAQTRSEEVAKQRADAIKARAEAEARFQCEHSLNRTVGTPAFDKCVQDSYKIRIANEIEAIHKREEQRRIEALSILSEAAARHGSVSCTQAFGTTRCDY